MQVLYQLDVAASSVDDLDQWLQAVNMKLKHMREDIASVCICSIDADSVYIYFYRC